MDVPCRKCARCRQFRQMRWRERAIYEMAIANRTWAVTLTFSPIQLAGVLASAKGPELVDVERRAYADVQRYFKRLRKGGAVFRYLAVFERGEESGRMHYHVLLHETGRFPVPKGVLDEAWPSFVHARLVDSAAGPGAASYITKYATKELSVRPRASERYGRNEGEASRAGAKSDSVHTAPHTSEPQNVGEKKRNDNEVEGVSGAKERTNRSESESSKARETRTLGASVERGNPSVILLNDGCHENHWSCDCFMCREWRERWDEYYRISNEKRSK
nr:MAG: replication initiator protein [Microvirus sp.]